MVLLDAHCHLELFIDVEKKIKKFPEQLNVITMTNTPKTFKKNMEMFNTSENIFVAVGLHPQLVSERIGEIGEILKLINQCLFIGEIGIDGGLSNLDDQIYVFSEIINHIDNTGGRVVSIHSRNATKLIVLLLHDLISNSSNKYILHWFLGSKSEVFKAIEIGCYFSINPRMLTSKKGRDVIRTIPSNKILVETDFPFTSQPRSLNEIGISLVNTIAEIEKLRGELLFETILENSNDILSGIR